MLKKNKYEDRLKNMVILDKKQNHIIIQKILKVEIYNLLENYFNINIDDLNISIDVNQSNMYILNINLVSDTIKKVKFI